MGHIGGGLRGELRLAVRRIARTPLFSGVVISVIALGIGINAGLLTTLDVYVRRPAPGIAPGLALVRITATAARGSTAQPVEVALSYPDVRDLGRERRVFAGVAAWGYTPLAADFGGGAEPVEGFFTTGNYFTLLGVAMAAGTGFPPAVDEAAAPVAVISHSVWMRRFDGSPDVIGRTIRVMNVPFTVVGVAQAPFTGVDVVDMDHPAVWLPLSSRALVEPGRRDELARREVASLEAVARLAPGVRPAEVGSLTARLAARLAGEDPVGHRRLALRAGWLRGMSLRDSGTVELVVAIAIVAVLIVIITCTNVSALLLGRAVARRGEIGVRLALGATRLRIIRQLLAEALVFAAAGALLALALYAIAIRHARTTIPDTIYGLEPKPVTFLAAAALALITTIGFGLVPALYGSRAGIGETIKSGGPRAVRRSRLQAAFVVLQLASSQPVLVVTGLVLVDLRSASIKRAAPAPREVLTMRARLLRPGQPEESPPARDSAAAAVRHTLGLIRRRLIEVPGVELAAVNAESGSARFEVPAGRSAPSLQRIRVTAGYFEARGIPLLRGRAIGAEDDHPGSNTVVVSQAVGERLWPGEDPIGRRLLRYPSDGAEGAPVPLLVIGVAGRAPYEEAERAETVFEPLSAAGPQRGAGITVRTSGDARLLVPTIRAAVREVEPYAALDEVLTLAERYEENRRSETQANLAAFAVGAAALLLASLGLYAIIAFSVAQRTHEIGVRLAIGASPAGVVGRFVRDGIKVSALGLAIGLPLSVAGIRVVQANLVGFVPRMAGAAVIVTAALVAVAALASWLPARRAGRVDPVIALRSE